MFEVIVEPLATSDAIAVRRPDGVTIHLSSSVPAWAEDAVIADLQRAISHADSPDVIMLPAGQAARNTTEPVITLRDTHSKVTPKVAMVAAAEAGVAIMVLSSDDDLPLFDDDLVPQALAEWPFWPGEIAEGFDHWLDPLLEAI